MTDVQIDSEIKYAHLGWRDTRKRRANRATFKAHIEAIWAEYLAAPRIPVLDRGLRLAPRYATGRSSLANVRPPLEAKDNTNFQRHMDR